MPVDRLPQTHVTPTHTYLFAAVVEHESILKVTLEVQGLGLRIKPLHTISTWLL